MPSASAGGAPVTLFYSYAHEDAALREELDNHLKILQRRRLIAPWHDRHIVPGREWAAEIDDHLRTADLVLLLASADFIASDYIFGVELEVAMQRHAKGEAAVVPIMVRAFDYDPDELPFLKLQGLPTDLRPVTSWPNRDEAWTDVARGLRRTVNDIRARRPAQPHRATTLGRVEPAAAVDHADSPAATDAVLQRLLAGVVEQVQQAQHARGERPLDEQGMERLQDSTLALIDTPEQKRVLWVDDNPGNNLHEAGVLAKLQIDVVTERSTDEAMRRLATDVEGFDLVISDWDRPAEGADAGLRLLQRLRAEGHGLPVIYYHGAHGAQRAGRARRASAAGALGEAVLPGELMALVRLALQGR